MARHVVIPPGSPPLLPIHESVSDALQEPSPVEQPDSEACGSGLPGDSHLDPAPFDGMGLSHNPVARISPQQMPATIYGQYTPPSFGGGSPFKERHSAAMRKLVSK